MENYILKCILDKNKIHHDNFTSKLFHLGLPAQLTGNPNTDGYFYSISFFIVSGRNIKMTQTIKFR